MLKPLSDELYHYTGIQGLKGIIESRTLWATHYKYLNDGEEIVHFRELLPNIFRPVLKKAFDDLPALQDTPLFKEYSSIEDAIEGETRKLTSALFDVTFSGATDRQVFTEPYIASFCTVEKHNDQIANHGLLSQWRGYGTDGGYVIVFDTNELINLLDKEKAKWAYSVIFAGDVVYSSATEKDLTDEFREQFKAIEDFWGNVLRRGFHGSSGDTYGSIVSCACRYKHWGFSEEKEFRIVVIPMSLPVIEVARKGGKDTFARKTSLEFSAQGHGSSVCQSF